ncbi:MAG: HAD family hydrolase [Ferroplasma sp.]
MKNKALFVDRDGTINYDTGYTYRIEDLRIYDDIIPIIKNYYDMHYLIIVITNQSGINRGYYTENQMKLFNSKIEERLCQYGIKITEIFFCPHTPEEACKCRKPETGMVEEAARKYNICLAESIILGDNNEVDGELARRLSIKFIKVHGNQ